MRTGRTSRRSKPNPTDASLVRSFKTLVEYEATVRENVEVGDLEAEGGRALAEAVARAGLEDMVKQLDHGPETNVSRSFSLGEQGPRSLSGGEWQRIAIARALMRRDAQIMLLDEPTSRIDPDIEHIIADRLSALKQGRCLIMVTHRLAHLQNADSVMVIKDGSIRECGDPQWLLTRDGEFARLVRRSAVDVKSSALAR